jgi:hypothetical protein
VRGERDQKPQGDDDERDRNGAMHRGFGVRFSRAGNGTSHFRRRELRSRDSPPSGRARRDTAEGRASAGLSAITRPFALVTRSWKSGFFLAKRVSSAQGSGCTGGSHARCAPGRGRHADP